MRSTFLEMKRKPMVQHKSGDQVEARKRSGGKLVIVNDKMQRGYRYVLAEPIGRNFDTEFKPELTPKEMLALGVFGGKYMTDCRKEFPSSWFTRAKLSPAGRNDTLNYFGVDASQPLSVWRQNGWLHDDDPRGWFQLGSTSMSGVTPVVSNARGLGTTQGRMRQRISNRSNSFKSSSVRIAANWRI